MPDLSANPNNRPSAPQPAPKPVKEKKRRDGSFIGKIFWSLFSLAMIGVVGGIGGLVAILFYFGHDLPDYKALANYDPPIVTRAYASDGRLMAEFATEKRVFVPIDSVPPLVKNAFISAEDKNFYIHPGIDPLGVIRATLKNISHAGSDKRLKGASTITQQVAKNFLLKDEVEAEKGDIVAKMGRKIREAILSFRIEQVMSKNKILELYLNEIYLGQRAYGVAAAALEYFDKPLDELTIEEAAFLGGLPKAPSEYSPERHYDAAIGRRNYVLQQMQENGYITKAEYQTALAKPIVVHRRGDDQYVNYPFFAEEVRRKLQELYGDKGLYEGGLITHATMIPAYQKIAETALRHGLIAYDSRYGLHSAPVAHIDVSKDWHTALMQVPRPAGLGDFELGAVLAVNDKNAEIGLKSGKTAVIPYANMKWAHKRGQPEPKKVSDVLKVGDVWMTENANQKEGDQKDDEKPAKKGAKTAKKEPGRDVYWLRQIPAVEGGMIVMDPHTGRIFAVVGGFSQETSQFNRATQALRQPGSSFKPFVYLAGLEAGFTPATLILDAPFVLTLPGQPAWRPQNYHEETGSGPMTMREGLEKSRNLMTIRLANYIGMDKVVEVSNRFGVIDNLPPMLSMAIGAGETTLLRMVTAYSSFVNGGKKITPTLIDRIQDRHGKTIFVHDLRDCPGCGPLTPWNKQEVPEVPDTRPQIADPRYVYQIVSMLEGVVQRGTGTGIKDIGRPVAGKTGTTNDSKDAWFIGFTPDIIVGAYVGFDNPKPMGGRETGGRIAVPIVKEFMVNALKDVPPLPFRVPPGIRLVQINPDTGTRSGPNDQKSILEAFIEGTEPTNEPTMFTGQGVSTVSDVTHVGEGVNTGLGGLY